MVGRDSNYLDVWKISEDEFPKDGPMLEKLKFFLLLLHKILNHGHTGL
jgi:hypothetical protein